MIIKDNWTEGTKYSTNANGPGNTWENNGPEVDAAIKERAGLELGVDPDPIRREGQDRSRYRIRPRPG